MRIFVIAEAGVNHNGSLKMAKQLVDVAHQAGADAVKFQTFSADELVCQHAPKANYQKLVSSVEETQHQMLQALELTKIEQVELKNYCHQHGILFLSSPFDLGSVDFIAQVLEVPLIKIPSGEITNLPLLLKVAHTGKKAILSTGMSTLGEIEEALAILSFGYLHPHEHPPSLLAYETVYFSEEGRQVLHEKVSLLHCTSEYPCPFQEVNLHALKTLKQAFGLPVGYSDHTLGSAIAIAAAARGARLIEKHFTLDKTMTGPDHKASLEPHELATMVEGIRQVEIALGRGLKIPTPSELKNRSIARKSLVSLGNIKPGELFTDNNLGCKRPGSGISPTKFYEYKNKPAAREYHKDELIE